MSASYRGRIAPRKQVTVTLSADFSNTGAALLMAGAAGFTTPAVGDAVEVVPGGTKSIRFKNPANGTMVINIDFADEEDSGKLEVTVGETLRDEGAVQGDTDWSYLIK